MQPDQRLSIGEEKERYLHHQNGPQEAGYVKFLERIITPALEYLSDEMVGLDYGCGPSPTLSVLLERKGISCHNYDPVFGYNYPRIQYDFIFATESFEHFYNPKEEITRIKTLLKPLGYLFIMTERWETTDQFRKWYYNKDPTHVCFYHKNTFQFIRQQFLFEELYHDKNRIILLRDCGK